MTRRKSEEGVQQVITSWLNLAVLLSVILGMVIGALTVEVVYHSGIANAAIVTLRSWVNPEYTVAQPLSGDQLEELRGYEFATDPSSLSVASTHFDVDETNSLYLWVEINAFYTHKPGENVYLVVEDENWGVSFYSIGPPWIDLPVSDDPREVILILQKEDSETGVVLEETEVTVTVPGFEDALALYENQP